MSTNKNKTKESKAPKSKEQIVQEMEVAYVEGKIVEMNAWLKEHRLAIQATLDYSPFGIRPKVQLVKVPDDLVDVEKVGEVAPTEEDIKEAEVETK